ncbi:MAG: bifunctional DNA-formamidopyrimidine glycosylase/DNA-(apurinic or apyrimidinic site) lyase [Fidelibacterota bacterium]|nr:MAG: bifunctional DNA-formamidopyrimidine glycosylase/DNA-(apurinic or apyrimidinic site) lyase [Candidatus Neomarinimicrobiota bacterium]
MPELPEVETVVRYLRPHLGGQVITDFHAHWPKVTAPIVPEEFAECISGRTIREVDRRGKYILWNLDQGHIHIHLRMTGQLSVISPGEVGDGRHITAEFTLSNSRQVAFRDTRKFGRIGYMDDLHALESGLGIEPLSAEFSPEWLHRELASRRRQIKPLLLDQAFIAGLGNIYVDEALFVARIHPLKKACDLSSAEAGRLQEAIQEILKESIHQDGTTIISFGFGEGRRGRYRELLQVFRRDGEPCPRCRTPLVKIRVAQRGTHLCPACQVPG